MSDLQAVRERLDAILSRRLLRPSDRPLVDRYHALIRQEHSRRSTAEPAMAAVGTTLPWEARLGANAGSEPCGRFWRLERPETPEEDAG